MQSLVSSIKVQCSLSSNYWKPGRMDDTRTDSNSQPRRRQHFLSELPASSKFNWSDISLRRPTALLSLLPQPACCTLYIHFPTREIGLKNRVKSQSRGSSEANLQWCEFYFSHGTTAPLKSQLLHPSTFSYGPKNMSRPKILSSYLCSKPGYLWSSGISESDRTEW